LTNEQRAKLLHQAGAAALELNRQLNLLYDGYDFCISRYHFDGALEQHELKELQASIKELSTLPKMVALELNAWSQDLEQTFSRIGFEIHVLNEIMIHMHAVAFFLQRYKIDLEPFSLKLSAESIAILRMTNRLLSTPAKA
jgi:hypothetical protein